MSSNNTSGESGSYCIENAGEDGAKLASELVGQFHSPNSLTSTTTNSNGSNTPPPPAKRKRNLPGNPDPSAEVIALSPNTLMATNRFVCEICNKGFQRDQNLQLHRRGHNLPWKLKQRSSTELVRKKVYVCPESSCVHHNPSRALGDLTGIKKHFCRKHGEKKWKCDKCNKKYAVQSDWKAHSKICGTREYKCDCGTIFSRRDSFITHRAFCDALAEENNKGIININVQEMGRMSGGSFEGQEIQNLVASLPMNGILNPQIGITMDINNKHQYPLSMLQELMPMPAPPNKPSSFNNNNNMNMNGGAGGSLFTRSLSSASSAPSLQLNSNNINGHQGAASSAFMSATALLQKAAQMGATVSSNNGGAMMNSSAAEKGFVVTSMAPASFGGSAEHPFMNLNQYMQMSGEADEQYGMNGVDMFNAILDHSKAFSKIIEENNRSSNNNNNGVLLHGGGSSTAGDIKASGDVMTLDFLGIGGGGHADFYGTQHQVAEKATGDEIWRNWSTKTNNAGSFESFSAASSIN